MSALFAFQLNESKTYRPHLSATGQVVRKSTRKDEANDDRCQCIDSLHAESLGEDVKEGVAGGVVHCAFDVDNDKQVADQEDDGENAAKEVRTDHCRGYGASSVLIVKSANVHFCSMELRASIP
jgi:hypothetical protein